MKRMLAFGIATAGLVAGLTFGTAGAASAAHCTENDSPGQSEYADHVRAASHSEGGTHKGNGSCQERSAVYTG